MSLHAQDLAARRAMLVERSRRLRVALAEDAAPLARRLRFVDRIVAVDRWDVARMLISGAATLFVFGRTRRLLRLALRVASLYPVVRPLIPVVGPLIGRLWRRRSARSVDPLN